MLPTEIEKLLKAAKAGRWGHRDATLTLVAYRLGLRAKEACELEWAQAPETRQSLRAPEEQITLMVLDPCSAAFVGVE